MQFRVKNQTLPTLEPYLLICLTAVMLMLPAALSPFRLHDSFWIDWVWADQFTDQLRRGNLYPRWLPNSHDGLGSPVFYYYPPLAFYLSGAFGLAGFSTYASIIAAFGTGLAASGVAMFLWLKDWARRPLFGALLFMGAPYHLLDLYSRGALAEFVAIAIVPLVALGMRRILEDRGGTLLAVAYAGLIATHLPLALLTSIFLVVPYAFVIGRIRLINLPTIVGALALGIALAAIYLLPALMLDAFRDADQLWAAAEFKTSYWSFLANDWSHGMKVLVAIITAGIAFPALYIAFSRRSGWALYAFAICLIVGGFVPFLWDLPVIKAVQFPYRALSLAEFGFSTALAVFEGRVLLALVMVAPSFSLSALFLSAIPPQPTGFTIEWMKSHYPDVPEYLPRGDRPYSWPSIWAIELASDHRTVTYRNGVTVDPVFYFPSWQVRCQGKTVRTFPAPETRLLAYRGDKCDRSVGLTPSEIAGAFLSLIAIVVLLMRIKSIRYPRLKRRECPA